ncbi:hypothetical protein [Victivallis sp. Marseille-Q1083]|uniref:hypothetical protein n=1 Tax=Victivallis sp. Marseille-Q1083 TaxID=2717288 RepID=UPI00158A150A|nr:hypothetical protein [Victivallis sp. Marseille-Q1083]
MAKELKKLKAGEVIARLLDEIKEQPDNSVRSVAGKLGYRNGSGLSNWKSESHRVNPLEQIARLTQASRSELPLQWLCVRNGGRFIRTTPLELNAAQIRTMKIDAIPQALRNFSQVTQAIADALRDNSVTAEEAAHIRAEWEKLRENIERFVTAAEAGILK